MDAIVRRGHLRTAVNPNTRIDYVVNFAGAVGGHCSVTIRYIPDQSILTPDSLAVYFETLGAVSWSHLEEIAISIISDLNNELVPRWVQVTVSGTGANLMHSVTLEDRQPRWDNANLLARLRAP